MSEVLLKIEGEDREGVLAVGSYLIDATGRLGIRIDDDPANNAGVHTCGVVIESGHDVLSELTETERKQFEEHGRKDNERLACQVKFVKPGEVTIMTEDKKKNAAPEESDADQKERLRKEFEEMPLEKKIANLLQFEIIALGETVKFVLDSPYKIVDKVMDVMAEFGLKKDEEAKKANRPAEHHDENGRNGANSKKQKQDAPAAG